MINPFSGGAATKSPAPACVRPQNLVGVYAMTAMGDFHKADVLSMLAISEADASKYLYVIEAVGGGDSGSSFAANMSAAPGHYTSTGGRGGAVARSSPLEWSELSDGWVVVGAGGQAAAYWNGFVNPGGSTFYIALPDDALAGYTGGIPTWDPSVMTVIVQTVGAIEDPPQILPQLTPYVSDEPSSVPGITSTIFSGAPGPYTTPLSLIGHSASSSFGPGSGGSGAIDNSDEQSQNGYGGGASAGARNAAQYLVTSSGDQSAFSPFYGQGGDGGQGGVGHASNGTNGSFPGGGGGGAGWDLSDNSFIGGNGADGVFRVYVYKI